MPQSSLMDMPLSRKAAVRVNRTHCWLHASVLLEYFAVQITFSLINSSEEVEAVLQW